MLARCFYLRILMAVVAVCMVNQVSHGQQWNQFLGPDGASKAENASPATDLAPAEIVWSTDISGNGWSSPVYSDNKVWLTTSITQKASQQQIEEKRKGVQFAEMKTVAGAVDLKAVCINLENGNLLHDIKLASLNSPELINPMNSYASPTAAIADGKVVCHFGADGTWCLDSSTGEKIWETKYVVDHSVGAGSSPIIFDDKVILVCDGIDQQFVAAVALADGKEVWKTNRPKMRSDNGEFQKAYSTPIIIDVDGKSQAVIPSAQWICAYDPNDGKELWRVDHGSGFSVTPMASYEAGLVLFSTGFMQPEVVAIDPRGSGDVTQTHVKWKLPNGPDMPSMVSSDGKAYFVSRNRILHCVDVANGKLLGRRRLKGNYSATPLLAGGHLYLSSREGTVTVVKADDNLEIVSTHSFDQPILASPAPIGDDLLFRIGGKLIRFGKTAG